jgi:Pretoxin HINT domain
LADRPEPDHVGEWEPASAKPGQWVDARDLRAGDLLLQRSGDVVKIKEVRPHVQWLEVYNLHVVELQSYAVGFSQVLTHNYPPAELGAGAGEAAPAELGAGAGMERQPGTLEGPVSFGKNFMIKVRKHINQVRNRGSVLEDIPSPG